MVLRLTSYSPRRSGFFVTVISRVFSQDLTPASRRQDHTTSPSALAPFVKGAIRVHRSPPHTNDVAQRPSSGTGRQRIYDRFDFGKTEIFLRLGRDKAYGTSRA